MEREFLTAFSTTLIVEILIGFALGLRRQHELLALVGVNCVTHPPAFHAAASLGISTFLGAGAALELGVVAAETTLLGFALGAGSWKRWFMTALWMNLGSFLTGVALWW